MLCPRNHSSLLLWHQLQLWRFASRHQPYLHVRRWPASDQVFFFGLAALELRRCPRSGRLPSLRVLGHTQPIQPQLLFRVLGLRRRLLQQQGRTTGNLFSSFDLRSVASTVYCTGEVYRAPPVSSICSHALHPGHLSSSRFPFDVGSSPLQSILGALYYFSPFQVLLGQSL